ncbi:MAG: hypothetical protein QOJ80_2793 [Mycobacterium sp.]|nr:hypothetical protein [Mycobacterium sp.]
MSWLSRDWATRGGLRHEDSPPGGDESTSFGNFDPKSTHTGITPHIAVMAGAARHDTITCNALMAADGLVLVLESELPAIRGRDPTIAR